MSEEQQEFTKEELLTALRALRKRIKLYRQDDESRLGGPNLSSGRTSAIVGVRLPDGFPAAIWTRLLEQGRIHSEGSGTYSIVD